MKVFIVEDEIPAQEELARVLKKHFPDISISGAEGSVKGATEWLEKNTADLIFMDIQLSDGCCFDIFNAIEVRTPIIFTTAYDQYALKAFKVNSVDYLLKPVDEDELVAAVRKLNYNYLRVKDLAGKFFPSQNRYKTRIAVRSGNSYGFLPIEKVSHFISEDGLTLAVSDSGEKYMVDYTIESLEPLLDPKLFFRATRGCIVSINSIERVSRHFNSRLKVTLKGHDGFSLILSRVRVPDFLKWIDDK